MADDVAVVYRCNKHHAMEPGVWLNMTYLRVRCELCDDFTRDIACNCVECPAHICNPCIRRYGQHVGFALHVRLTTGRILDEGALEPLRAYERLEEQAGPELLQAFGRFSADKKKAMQ